jgi:hypothetical protein
MKIIYLINYDNEGQYEDYYTHPLFAVESKERAEQIKDELNTWMREAFKNQPPEPSSDEPDDVYMAKHDSITGYYQGLKHPYGLECLTESLRFNDNGKVFISELKVL